MPEEERREEEVSIPRLDSGDKQAESAQMENTRI